MKSKQKKGFKYHFKKTHIRLLIALGFAVICAVVVFFNIDKFKDKADILLTCPVTSNPTLTTYTKGEANYLVRMLPTAEEMQSIRDGASYTATTGIPDYCYNGSTLTTVQQRVCEQAANQYVQQSLNDLKNKATAKLTQIVQEKLNLDVKSLPIAPNRKAMAGAPSTESNSVSVDVSKLITANPALTVKYDVNTKLVHTNVMLTSYFDNCASTTTKVANLRSKDPYQWIISGTVNFKGQSTDQTYNLYLTDVGSVGTTANFRF